jgi:hypothetical protein
VRRAGRKTSPESEGRRPGERQADLGSRHVVVGVVGEREEREERRSEGRERAPAESRAWRSEVVKLCVEGVRIVAAAASAHERDVGGWRRASMSASSIVARLGKRW